MSLNLLKSEIMDGNERKINDVFSNSLPLVSKEHIFDGLDVNFIEQDILNVKSLKNTKFQILEGTEKRERFRGSNTMQRMSSCCTENMLKPKLNTIDNYKKKYRDFLKDQEFRAAFVQLRRYPRPMRHHSTYQPNSYNSFIMSGVEDREERHSLSPHLVISSVRLPAKEPQLDDNNTAVAGLPLLQLQIDRVKELVGRREKGRVRHRAPKLAERNLTSRRSKVNVTGTELIDSWDRMGTTLFPSSVTPPKSRRSDARPSDTSWDCNKLSPKVKNILSPNTIALNSI